VGGALLRASRTMSRVRSFLETREDAAPQVCNYGLNP
jgi:hypothetical protein